MKRLLCLLLSVLTLLSLCACGTSGQNGNNDTTTESTGLPAGIMQTEDPEGDATMNVLFISNSTSWYFTDALYGMLAAAGKPEVNLCHAYYSGCSLKQHYDFWKTGATPYQFKVTSKNGVNITKEVGLETALAYQNWDYIVFHNNAHSYRSENAETAYTETEPYLKELLAFVRKEFPLSTYLWSNTHTPNVGYSLSYQMTSIEQRDRIQQTNSQVSEFVKRDFGLDIVPCGKAWEKVRDLPLFATPDQGVDLENVTLFTRVEGNKVVDDSVHEGDIGGGQYLNACVWFEALTGESCIGNTYQPGYTYLGLRRPLSQEKIDTLQKAAHEAVEENKK